MPSFDLNLSSQILHFTGSVTTKKLTGTTDREYKRELPETAVLSKRGHRRQRETAAKPRAEIPRGAT